MFTMYRKDYFLLEKRQWMAKQRNQESKDIPTKHEEMKGKEEATVNNSGSSVIWSVVPSAL